jgi:hypothetical protein
MCSLTLAGNLHVPYMSSDCENIFTSSYLSRFICTTTTTPPPPSLPPSPPGSANGVTSDSSKTVGQHGIILIAKEAGRILAIEIINTPPQKRQEQSRVREYFHFRSLITHTTHYTLYFCPQPNQHSVDLPGV